MLILCTLTHLALVLFLSQLELDERVTQTVLVHRTQVPAFDEPDADNPSPVLRFPMLPCETHRLLLLVGTHKDTNTDYYSRCVTKVKGSMQDADGDTMMIRFETPSRSVGAKRHDTRCWEQK